MGIFDKRTNYKPFEYEEADLYAKKINEAYWVHSEVNFTGDVQDFRSDLSLAEQEAIKRSLLAIAQIEVSVKSFWGDLYKHLPKPEFNGLGATFAESEFRHSEAYSRLLEILGFNHDFVALLEVPCIKKRIDYLTLALQNTNSKSPNEYLLSLILFSILIENVSLFSQFATVLSFSRFKGCMKNVANIIAWTSVDEQIHANAGIYIVQTIIKENPDFMNDETKEKIRSLVKHSIETESEILDWIFEKGDLQHIQKKDLLNFMKSRLDKSIEQIGIEPIFNMSQKDQEPMFWFQEEMFARRSADFFVVRPTDYTKFNMPITSSDLFDDSLNNYLQNFQKIDYVGGGSVF